MSRCIGIFVLAAVGMIVGCQPAQRLESVEDAATVEEAVEAEFAVDIEAAEQMVVKDIIGGVDDRYKAGFIARDKFYGDFSKMMLDLLPESSRIRSQEINVQHKRIVALAVDAALVTASGDYVATTTSGETFGGDFNWTFVYVKIGEKWKVIHSHQSGSD